MGFNILVFDHHASQEIISTVLNQTSFSVGRDRGCNIVIPATYSQISGKHLLFRVSHAYIEIHDGDTKKPSTNGCYINGHRIMPACWTRHNLDSVISMGNPSKYGSLCLRISMVSNATSWRNQANLPPISTENASVLCSDVLRRGSSAHPIHLALVRPERTRPYSHSIKNIGTHLIILIFILLVIAVAFNGSQWLGAIIIGSLVMIEIYFMPTTIAFSRGLPNKFAIFAINLCLGFTILGWAVSLAWSLSAR